MKKMLILVAMMTALAFSVVAFGQDVAPATSVVTDAQAAQLTKAPAWLLSAMEYVASIPKVGPVVVEIAKWMGVLTTILAVLSTLLIGIGQVFERLGKKFEFGVKAKAMIDKIYPFVAWLSAYNVKKLK